MSMSYLVTLEVGCETALIADSGGVQAVLVLDESPEVVVCLTAHAKGLAEASGSDGEDHELLFIQKACLSEYIQ